MVKIKPASLIAPFTLFYVAMEFHVVATSFLQLYLTRSKRTMICGRVVLSVQVCDVRTWHDVHIV
ncbi:hypothetical protein NEOLEDRAFT_1141103 [Neolentinus lepideus HHB14362 ss-1]|uniref:Uncharacterized protein n=1 Tax=Neolentinus lepideus HHB14362 ss-1 TaxID=1314782 RepID=A0A165NUX4_9AGAM|nr:hypothetical protein NEOLEDRAFT_1141103 [Neolentinus lepideus HHB14362 ss-1]